MHRGESALAILTESINPVAPTFLPLGDLLLPSGTDSLAFANPLCPAIPLLRSLDAGFAAVCSGVSTVGLCVPPIDSIVGAIRISRCQIARASIYVSIRPQITWALIHVLTTAAAWFGFRVAVTVELGCLLNRGQVLRLIVAQVIALARSAIGAPFRSSR